MALPGRIARELGRYKMAEAVAIIEPIVQQTLESLSRGEEPPGPDPDE